MTHKVSEEPANTSYLDSNLLLQIITNTFLMCNYNANKLFLTFILLFSKLNTFVYKTFTVYWVDIVQYFNITAAGDHFN